MKLRIYTSADATNFTLYADTGYSGPPGCSLRDPSIMKHTDGRYYVVFTSPPYNKPYARQNFVGLAWSTNLQTWNTMPSIYTTNIPGVKLSWAPEWVVDGSDVPKFIVHCSSASSDLRPYLYTATNSDLTGWAGPVDIGIGSMHLDGQILKVGNTWHCFIKSNLLHHATAPSVTGPWTWLPDRADWANLEGPCVVQRTDGSWLMYVDPMYDVAQYMTSSDLTNWSPLFHLPGPGNIIKHGTVIRDDAFNLPPTGLRATSGNATVTLQWNAFAGAASYNVKRALTDGGPYSIITNVFGTGLTDPNVTNDVTYSYVVSTIYGGSESLDSAAATATPRVGNASLVSHTSGGIKKHFPKPDRIRYDGHCFTIDGQDTFIRSAEFHYFRTPRELWHDRFQKIKEAGFNAVDTYVPWNWHEREMPARLNDFSKVDLSEVEAWLKMAQNEFGFYTIVRPGPFICAEWAGGGYPRWLAKFAPTTGDHFWLRSPEDSGIAWSVHWYDTVCKLFATEQITRKPKGAKGIILMQIENEYDAFKCADKPRMLRALYQAATNSGMDVPIFTCLTRECRGSSDPVLSQVFDCDNYYVGLTAAPSCAQRMTSLRAVQPDAPGFVTELQGGWFALVGDRLSEENYSDARHYNAISLMSLLGGATGLNTYMFVGGTHFGGWQARGQTTTYDYNAPIREWGARGEKYLVAEGVNQFIRENETPLLRASGGPCELQGAPTNLFGGVRVGPDGTRFVFLHNTDPKNPVSGKVAVVAGKVVKPNEPIYNIDQDGNRVMMKADDAVAESTTIPAFDVAYNLDSLGAKVLVIPPGKTPAEGVWYPKPQKPIARPATLPAPVRITTALKQHEPLHGEWQPLPGGKSLPELGVNDQRYVLYRARFALQNRSAAVSQTSRSAVQNAAAGFQHSRAPIDETNLTKLLVNSFSRDIISAEVNGEIAKRLYPSDAYISAATRDTKKSFKRIEPDEFDNRFEVENLLHAGTNEIVLLYENIGFEHGYFPMEELSGLRKAGLSDSEKAVTKQLEWQVATNLGGVTAGWMQPGFTARGWSKVALDTRTPIARKGNGIQPTGRQDALLTWYWLEFELPATPADQWIPWRLLINASGNGFMWLNGHDIGKHWEAGPQREFYLPECWLKFGGEKNVIVLGLRQTVNGAKLNAAEVSPYPDSAEQISAN